MEARTRLDKVEAALEGLPAVIAEAVLADLQPFITRTNGLIDRFNTELDTLNGLAATVRAGSESQEVLALEFNSLRVDLNAAREVTQELSGEVAAVAEKLARIQTALSSVAKA